MTDLFEALRPLASETGEVDGVPYLLQPNFPLWLSNTAFGYNQNALKEVEAKFTAVGAPPAFLLPQQSDASELLNRGYSPQATFELCPSEPSVRSYWTEHVPWSEAWTIGKILTEAYGAPQWRFPVAQSIGKLLQKPDASAFVAYLYGEAVGALLTHKGIGILCGVIPDKHGNGLGAGLIGRIYPMPFIRLAGLETEFPAQAQRRFVRYSLPIQDKRP